MATTTRKTSVMGCYTSTKLKQVAKKSDKHASRANVAEQKEGVSRRKYTQAGKFFGPKYLCNCSVRRINQSKHLNSRHTLLLHWE